MSDGIRIEIHVELPFDRLQQLQPSQISALMGGIAQLLAARFAGAPDGVGKSGANVATEGGESRSHLEPKARTESAAPADGVSASVVSRVSSSPAKPRGTDDLVRESASTAEGSTRNTCQFCEKEFSVTSRRGLPTHERWCEKNPERERWDPQPVGLGGGATPATAARETFLCDRCQRPFPSRQALAEHRRGHVEVPPAPGPMRRATGSLSETLGIG